MEQVFSEESDEGGGVDETAPPKPSRGPEIEFPMQRKDIDLLIEAFRKKKVCNTTSFNFRALEYWVMRCEEVDLSNGGSCKNLHIFLLDQKVQIIMFLKYDLQ